MNELERQNRVTALPHVIEVLKRLAQGHKVEGKERFLAETITILERDLELARQGQGAVPELMRRPR